MLVTIFQLVRIAGTKLLPPPQLLSLPFHRQGARNFPIGLTLPTRGLKYGFQGTINVKNLRRSRFSPFDGGLACSNGGYSPLALPGCHSCSKGESGSTMYCRRAAYWTQDQCETTVAKNGRRQKTFAGHPLIPPKIC